MEKTMQKSAAAKWGFRVAVTLAALGLFSVPLSPVPAAGMLAGYSMVAWGIARRQRFAPLAGAFLALLPAILLGARANLSAFPATALAMNLVLLSGIGAVFVWCAWEFRNSASVVDLAWFAAIFLAGAAAWYFRLAVIPTGSMENTLLVGDHLLVRPAGGQVQRGDIILYRPPAGGGAGLFTHRVVGVAGDRIRVQAKMLLRDGGKVAESFVSHKTDFIDPYRDNFPGPPNVRVHEGALRMLEKHQVNGEVVIPPGHLFVMGDNRDLALDSRYLGLVPSAAVEGKALLIYHSVEPGPDASGSYFPKIRWRRLLKPVQ
jgi:signal peptidase I